MEIEVLKSKVHRGNHYRSQSELYWQPDADEDLMDAAEFNSQRKSSGSECE